jgi:predicted MFS family arabinose efflux permease
MAAKHNSTTIEEKYYKERSMTFKPQTSGSVNSNKSGLTPAILSLSLLTVMAGAAIAPALNVIKEYFGDVDQTLVQMIISVPAIFIVLTNLVFPALCRRFRNRTLLMTGLAFYIIGGCVAGAFSNIFTVLAARAFVGIGVGIVMPMSTGLIALYFDRDQQDRMMGCSSAMNQLGGTVAVLLSGLLAQISWRASFLVYLMGMISVVLCMMYLPNDYMHSGHSDDEPHTGSPDGAGAGTAPSQNEAAGLSKRNGVFHTYYPYIIGMYLLMTTFFIYPSSFAMESAAEGVLSQTAISVLMALLDVLGFLGGMMYARTRKVIGINTRFVSPALFIAGYALLAFIGGWTGAIAGSFLVGFASGEGIPFIISSASQKAGREAPTTVLPLISAALYLAQFLTPFVLSFARTAFFGAGAVRVSYKVALVTAVLFCVWSAAIGKSRD